MISAGNDIVALNAIDKGRSCMPAFYSKFITPTEFALYNQNEITLVNFIWLLWSVKESAYKYLKRTDNELVFSPIKLPVSKMDFIVDPDFVKPETDQLVDIFCSGIINHADGALRFQSAINDAFVSSIIKSGNVYWGITTINAADYESQSKAVRLFTLNKLAKLLQLKNPQIKKHDAGYPFLTDDDIEINVPISFAHHDRYLSYSFQIPK